jgi:hypothetical protein
MAYTFPGCFQNQAIDWQYKSRRILTVGIAKRLLVLGLPIYVTLVNSYKISECIFKRNGGT